MSNDKKQLRQLADQFIQKMNDIELKQERFEKEKANVKKAVIKVRCQKELSWKARQIIDAFLRS